MAQTAGANSDKNNSGRRVGLMAEQAIIIKRADEEEHDGHHGGAWKVAYADFMTAMMAFFCCFGSLRPPTKRRCVV
jgi:hypothetical protein